MIWLLIRLILKSPFISSLNFHNIKGEDALSEKLGAIRQTLNTWISDIRARQRAGRNINIIRLNRLGWTQEQIARTVGLSRNRISEIVGNTIFGNIDTLLSQGRDMNYIAEHYHLDLAWPGPCDLKERRILGTVGRSLIFAKRFGKELGS